MAPEETTGLTKEETVKDAKASEKPTEKKKVETEPRELDYLMVQHMGYAAETRSHRHLKAGNRRKRFMLDDGRRIQSKGERFDEVTFSDVLTNFNLLLGGVRDGVIRVCRPDNLQELTLEQFAELGEHLSDDFKKDLKIDETLLEPLVGSDLGDKKVWVEKPKGKDTEITKPSIEPAVIAAEERKKLDEEPKPAETGLLDDAGKDAEVAEPAVETPAEEEEGLTEEQMMEMSVKDLQKLAKDYGVKKPDKLHTKKELVDAIMEVASKEQE